MLQHSYTCTGKNEWEKNKINLVFCMYSISLKKEKKKKLYSLNLKALYKIVPSESLLWIKGELKIKQVDSVKIQAASWVQRIYNLAKHLMYWTSYVA